MNVEVCLGSHFVFLSASSVMAVSAACATSLQKVWEGSSWEGMWPFLDPWDVVRLRTSSCVGGVPGKYGPHGELFFFLIKKESLRSDKRQWCLSPLFQRRR